METIDALFGHGSDLNSLQMSIRAIVIFFIALILLRFSGMRIFGIKSAFDTCIVITLGSVLARAIVGASPFVPTIIASAIMMVVHKLIAGISVSNEFVSHLVKGKALLIYKEGTLNEKNLKKCSLSYGDIIEEIRLKLNQNTLDNIDEIYMERTGNISIILKGQVE